MGKLIPDLCLISSVNCFENGEPVSHHSLDKHVIISHGCTKCPHCSHIFTGSRLDENISRYAQIEIDHG